jgi:uncharacterized DUF497 family protein
MHVRFTWDERKRRDNLARHGLDFRDAEAVFAGPTLTIEDDRFPCPEHRFMTLGLLRETTVTIIHTETHARIHVISFRQATRHEEAILFRGLAN